MNITLSPAMRRALALLILLALLLLVWRAAVEPLIGLGAARRADITEFTQRLEHLEAIVARRPELQRQAASRERQLATAGGLWRGTSATAAAAIQDRLRTAVAAGGGRVDSSAEAHETVEHGFRKITVHFTIEGPLDTVTRTLSAVEMARPALFADGLTIAAPESDPAGNDHSPPVLRFDLDVTGYLAEPRS